MLEHIEDASSEAPPIWLARLKNDDPHNNNNNKKATPRWKPLRKVDCRTLNDRVGTESVFIEGGRAAATADEIIYNFIRGPIRELKSATWFSVMDETKKKDPTASQEEYLEPVVSESDTQKIESFYQSILQATSTLGKGVGNLVDKHVDLSDQSKVKVVRNAVSNTYCLRRIPNGWLKHTVPLQRGYGSYEVEGEETELLLGPVQHVVFVIHGIGESVWIREGVSISSMVESTTMIRESIQARQVKEWKSQCEQAQKTGAPLPSVPRRIEFIPIEWFDQLHNDAASWQQTLKATTLPSIPALRTLANDVILDVLFYMTPNFCQSVLETVTDQINTLYSKFLAVHPNFVNNDGSCSLAGHSLGSVIAWDLLAVLKDSKEQSPVNTCTAQDHRSSFAAQVGVSPTESQAAGSWRPPLNSTLTKVLPFEPQHTVLLGSPVGMFLTLRGAHGPFHKLAVEQDGGGQEAAASVDQGSTTTGVESKKILVSEFTLPTGSIHNIFHPSDPVAYRIEPLLLAPGLPPEDLPPPLYVTTPGQDVRLHVKARQLTNEIKKNFQTQKSSWSALINSAVSVISTTVDVAAPSMSSSTRSTEASLSFPLGGSTSRVDFSLQPGVVDNEYLSAVTAHNVGTYFGNEYVQDFLMGLVAETSM